MLAIKSVEINPQSVTTGQNVIISVLVIDVSWGTVKNEFQSWGDIKNNCTNWNDVKNYTG